MLTDVHVIDQKGFKNIVKLAIRGGTNVIILGPSGGGKTLIAMQASEEEKCRMVYINLAVLERTDFQGFPVVSQDKSLVSYATPDFLPFIDNGERDELRALNSVLSAISNDVAKKSLEKRINTLEDTINTKKLSAALPYLKGVLKDNEIKSLEYQIKAVLPEDDVPIVFLFDEIDKAATETTQTLLELLQFHSINGRKLNVKACILTGNLPDEHAQSAQISHAITKRCLTYKLQLEFSQWRDWAFRNCVHDLIIGFLTSNQEMLYKGPPDGDPTAYALPSPRTWTEAARALSMFDNDQELTSLSEEQAESLKLSLIAGSVGDTAAVKFANWYKYYRKLDPVISELVNKGIHPNTDKLQAQEVLIAAICACSKIRSYLKPNNDKEIRSVVKNVFGWIHKLSPDIQMGAARMSFGNDWDTVKKFNLAAITEFSNVFENIKKTLSNWDQK
jgi:MoxR-like ATPase